MPKSWNFRISCYLSFSNLKFVPQKILITLFLKCSCLLHITAVATTILKTTNHPPPLPPPFIIIPFLGCFSVFSMCLTASILSNPRSLYFWISKSDPLKTCSEVCSHNFIPALTSYYSLHCSLAQSHRLPCWFVGCIEHSLASRFCCYLCLVFSSHL